MKIVSDQWKAKYTKGKKIISSTEALKSNLYQFNNRVKGHLSFNDNLSFQFVISVIRGSITVVAAFATQVVF